jgi:tetratricopeptide (TPR) repeat protein
MSKKGFDSPGSAAGGRKKIVSMNRPARSLVVALCLSVFCSGLAFSQAAAPAAPGQSAPDTKSAEKAAAYYNFAMGHLYSELAGAFGNRSDYTNKAIDYYRQAMKLDPSAAFLSEELTDLYIQAGRIKDAVTEAEDLLKQNPNNLDARRLLGRIYARLIGDPQEKKVNEDMLRRAIEQFQKVTDQDPKDLESWLMLGRLERVSRDSVASEKAFKKALDLDASNEEALTGLAMVYSELGDTKNAIEMLRLVTSKNPNPRTLSALASFYERTRDFSSAAEAWRQALQMDPENSRIKRALAEDVLRTEHLEEALKLYSEIAAADPRDAQIQLRLSEIYRQKSDFSKARAAFNKAHEIDPDSLEVRYEEVNLLEAEGKNDDAIATLRAMLSETVKKSYSESEKGSRILLLEELGRLYREAGKYSEAVDAFRQIPQIDPEAAPRASVQVIDTWRMAKDLNKAQEEAAAAAKKFPKDRMVKLAHASLLSDLGKTDEAVAELRTLLDGERDREIQLAIAQIYEKGKRFTEMAQALDAAEKLSQSKQDKQTVLFMRGAMLERTKQFEAAESEFRKVLDMDPENAGALNYLGYMLADRNVRLDEANKLVSKAVELEPLNGAYLDSLGWVYYRQNRLEEAADYLQRALRKIGKDPTVHDHLGDVYFKQGKIREAIAQWQSSLKEYEANNAQADVDPGEMAKVGKKLEDARVRVAKEGSIEKEKQR